MGGINSGRPRSINRGAVEHYPAIDLRVLRRAGLLRAGECTYTTLCWRNQAPEALSVRIFIDLSDADDASMRIISSESHGAITERVAMHSSQPSKRFRRRQSFTKRDRRVVGLRLARNLSENRQGGPLANCGTFEQLSFQRINF